MQVSASLPRWHCSHCHKDVWSHGVNWTCQQTQKVVMDTSWAWIIPLGKIKKKKKSLPCTSKICIYNSLLGLYMFPWEISSSPLYPLAPKLQVLTENPVEDLENLLVVFAKEINQSSTLQFAMVSILAWLEGIRPESMLVTGKLLYK